MQPDVNATKTRHLIWSVARKELTLFFASPVAWLFLASFAAVELFVFFWGEAFFARNIADVRPLFSWMPLLLLFLTSALTMKVWSEERRSGTLEAVLTQGSPVWHFVLGKFLGCFVLLLLALLITLPLPATVAVLAELDQLIQREVEQGFPGAVLLIAIRTWRLIFQPQALDEHPEHHKE
jgi:ABC-2 type transport system permease protein